MFFVKNNKPFRFELIYLNVYGSAYDQPIMFFSAGLAFFMDF